MIENYRSIDSENDLQIIGDKSKLYSNNHYKTMIKLEYINVKSNHPHFINIIKDTYLDNIKINSKLKGLCNENNNYTNAILVHYHTRNLENTFVKVLSTNLNNKKITPDILNNKLSTSELKEKIFKLRLPMNRAKDKMIN